MTLHSYDSYVPAGVAAALSEFEKEFTYPLGPACRFRISHGDDYLGFARTMGDATLLVTADDGEITGGIARVKKALGLRGDPGGPVVIKSVHYLCDLKVRSEHRGSLVLSRLIRETKRQIEAGDTLACYSVVMGGTGRLPTDYTGRLGVPKFDKLADITILRLAAGDSGGKSTSCRIADLTEIRRVREEIASAGYHAPVRERQGGSLMPPVHLITASGDACGILEDTRRVKRLVLDSGEELVSAHLTALCYRTPEAAALLLREAVELARSFGCPAVFTAVPSARMPELRPCLAGLEVVEAPAAVFGVGLERGVEWWIDTVEI